MRLSASAVDDHACDETTDGPDQHDERRLFGAGGGIDPMHAQLSSFTRWFSREFGEAPGLWRGRLRAAQ